jgi:phosphopantothenoylcysteine decarboxylase/phosphopantothenate--cysteine ligase
VLEAIERVEGWGVEFVSPRLEEGKAKIASEDAIAVKVARATTPSPLADERVVVTSGATSEAIDPIRVLTNRSSGRTGREVARACYVRGAQVTLVHGPVGPHPVDRDGIESLPYVDLRSVECAAEMRETTLDVTAEADALVSAAAVGDYTADSSIEKIRSGRELSLDLEPAPKLIDAVREARPDLPIVGFKAETNREGMIEAARETLRRVDLAFVVANDAGVMGRADTSVRIVRERGTKRYAGSKAEIGDRVADELADVLATIEGGDG